MTKTQVPGGTPVPLQVCGAGVWPTDAVRSLWAQPVTPSGTGSWGRLDHAPRVGRRWEGSCGAWPVCPQDPSPSGGGAAVLPAGRAHPELSGMVQGPESSPGD